MSSRNKLEEAKLALATAESSYEHAFATGFMRGHDEAVRKFKYPPGKPVPTMVLKMISQASPDVKAAKEALDLARDGLRNALASSRLEEKTGPASDGKGELDTLIVETYQKNGAELLEDVSQEIDNISACVRRTKEEMERAFGDDARDFWEDTLQEFTIIASDISEYLGDLRYLLSLVRGREAGMAVKLRIELAKDLRKDARDFIELCRIKLRGW